MADVSEGRVRIEDAVACGHGGGRPLHCDLFHPPEAGADRPAVVLIHGGSWSGGDRAQLRGYGFQLARRGYVCAALEYRLSGEAKWPAQLHDLKAGLRYVRAHSAELGVDPAKINVVGHSAGAHLALMLAATPNAVEFEGEGGHADAGTDCASCVAFYPHTKLYGDDSPSRYAPGLFEAGVTEAIGRQASPIEYVRKEFPPTLLLHGNRDQLVPVQASLSMYDALINAGAGAELHIFNGVPHAFDASREFFRPCVDMIELFLSRHGSRVQKRTGEAQAASAKARGA